jgi:ABC-type uncharacterized transport system permease subunit
VTGNGLDRLAAGIAVSIGLALVHGFASHHQRGNQIVSGVAINFLAAGLTALLGQDWFRQGGRTPPLSDGGRFPTWSWPFADALARCRSSDPIYSELLSGHNILVYVALSGRAADLVGAVPHPLRPAPARRRRKPGRGGHRRHLGHLAALSRGDHACGVLCGVAGAYLSTAQSAGFIKDMTAGKGFIALAALIFAKWKPVPVMFACLLFGFLDAVAIRLQGQELPADRRGAGAVLPGAALHPDRGPAGGFIGKAIPPKAAGEPYVKERS